MSESLVRVARDIPSGPWGFIHLVGGRGGEPFSTTAATVKALDVWYSSSCLHGLQVTYSDASRSSIYGSTDDLHGRFDFQPGELLTSMTLWGNGLGTRTGRIRFTTNKSRSFDVGKDTSGQTAYDCPVSSGFLMGFIGRYGGDIDCLAALFLRSPVVSVSISEVSYNQNLIGSSTGIAPVALDEVDFGNLPTSSKPIAFMFKGSETRIRSTSHSQTTSDTFALSASVEVSGEILGVGAAGFKWQHGSSQTTKSSVSEEVQFNWEMTGELQPGESVKCLAVIYRGTCHLDYTSKVVVKLKDGFTNTFREEGTFDNIALSKVVVQSEWHSAQLSANSPIRRMSI
ncbi:Jacalin-like lectin domain-containing protein [Mycena pura]|uniref:Jacalin-like lectin domain-containing protein n=1 Tax=Mycena pura TaxID=153505 RepID=A0AAD7E064_9AGAR|nr:Jacalin-like lectin domain-containing protein [Mycena pura]